MLLFLPIGCSQILCKIHITHAWNTWVSKKENIVGEENDEKLRQHANFLKNVFTGLPRKEVSRFCIFMFHYIKTN